MGKFDKEIAEATAETNTAENWQKFMDLADRLQRSSTNDCRDAARALHKRLKERNALAVSYTISLVHALVNNAGAEFRKAFLSRDTLPVLKQVLKGSMPAKVKTTLSGYVVEWNNDFGSRPEFRILHSWIQQLQQDGLLSTSATTAETGVSSAFSSFPTTTSSARTAPSSSTSFLSPGHAGASAARQREAEQKYEADLAEAIKASLNEKSSSPARAHPVQQPQEKPSGQPVKVLYDFEGSEENELSLSAGDIIRLTDKSDPNWWRGISRGGEEGFFPSSFVSPDLNAEVVPDAPPAAEEEEEQQEDEQAVEEEEEEKEEKAAVVEEAVPVTKQDASGPTVTAGQKQLEEQAAAGADAVDRAKFERFFELVTTTQPGDHSHDEEIEALEQQCDAAIEEVSEKVDSYDRRLARINQMMEKYALIQALCTRLMAQEPGMARVTRAPHELGVGMMPSQTPPSAAQPHHPYHPHYSQQQQQQQQQHPGAHHPPPHPGAPHPGAPHPAHLGAAAGYPPHPQHQQQPPPPHQHQQQQQQPPPPHTSGMGVPQHYAGGRQQPSPMAGKAPPPPPHHHHHHHMQPPPPPPPQQQQQQQEPQQPPQFAYAGPPPPHGSHASNAPYQQEQQQPPQPLPQPQGSTGYRPPQPAYSQPPQHHQPHQQYHQQQQGPPSFSAQDPQQYHQQPFPSSYPSSLP